MLLFYEIQAILKQLPALAPVHDEAAAVKYVVFGGDQWVSYDDRDTFDAKIGWANAVGIGGSLIWAVDTDDDKFTAMSGLLGKEVGQVAHVDLQQNVLLATSTSIAQSLVGSNGQDCRVLKDQACTKVANMRCFAGETLVGWDNDGCWTVVRNAGLPSRNERREP